MPKLSESIINETFDMPEWLKELTISGELKVISAVSRKINTGNYENIDVLSALAIPMHIEARANEPFFYQVCEKLSEIGFAIASQETGERYQLIKDAQKGGRPAK